MQCVIDTVQKKKKTRNKKWQDLLGMRQSLYKCPGAGQNIIALEMLSDLETLGLGYSEWWERTGVSCPLLWKWPFFSSLLPGFSQPLIETDQCLTAPPFPPPQHLRSTVLKLKSKSTHSGHPLLCSSSFCSDEEAGFIKKSVGDIPPVSLFLPPHRASPGCCGRW